MNIINKAKAFLSFDMGTKLLLIEAFFYLGWARILKSIPFSKAAPILGIHMAETSLNYDESEKITLRKISQAVHMMSRYTFWESQCLVKAIAAMKMLEKRQIESTLYLGTAKDETGNMIAHAWLRSGPFYITGVEEMKRFTVVGKFAKRIG
ncbi:TPA: lasso peptide biosynthesis B2 protein [Bacillus cereus]|uniref:lasso peptide biosynthesis B2 protein n=1 Tax=Bacillus TaxID=1386 RepID=UPI000CFBF309|nr:lasso peptide biosynthesis B2 protein [Bacillus sp. MYb56]PRD09364.1 stage V sporulation protein S [Bacillus sp. MYb56]HDR3888953.1 lasso peptide biosynthesis B2 protein [Bacillus cereus]HDR7608804.1 lasso peptide biosynthesis B2 protein [Bacillus mycoides]